LRILHKSHVVANQIICRNFLLLPPLRNSPNRLKWLCVSTKARGVVLIHRKMIIQTCREIIQLKKTWLISSTSPKQKTQYLSWLLVIIQLQNSLVCNLSSNSLHLKIVTLDGTLFNHNSSKMVVGAGSATGSALLFITTV
jgi:hypothetical protein